MIRHARRVLSLVLGHCLLLAACLPSAPAPASPCIPAPPSATTPAAGSAGPSPTTEQPALLNAPLYAIELTVDPAAAQVTGHQAVRYTNAEETALDDLYLRLFPNTPGFGGEMTAEHLLLDGRAVTPVVELAGSALRLPLDPPLTPGQTITVGVDFAVRVPTTTSFGYGQFSYANGVMTLPNVYPLIPVYDDEGWNVEIAQAYGDPIYSDVASYTVRVTAPTTMTLVTSGSCAGVEPGVWACTAEPMRDFALVLAEDYQRASQLVRGVTVNSYFYSGHEQGGVEALRIAAGALGIYDDLFGPYPYAELDVVETPTQARGIEYPGLVVIAERLYTGDPQLVWVVAHYVGHQWWYSVVGNDQVDEPWLDEALTQYATLLYHEVVYGRETAADIRDRLFLQSHRSLIDRGEDMPVGLPVAAYDAAQYSAVVYRKGPLYFQALRERVGDELFFALLRTYYSRHQHGIATADSFVTTVRIVTGDAHTDLYEQWIAGE
jgi:hypothetical protein